MCCKVLIQLMGKQIEACYLTQLIEGNREMQKLLQVFPLDVGQMYLTYSKPLATCCMHQSLQGNAYCCIHQNPREAYPRVYWDSAMVVWGLSWHCCCALTSFTMSCQSFYLLIKSGLPEIASSQGFHLSNTNMPLMKFP